MTSPDAPSEGARHTPGPWTALTDDGRADGGIEITAPRDDPKRPVWYLATLYAMPEDAQFANAHLMACAPDMYEALLAREAAENANANCPECDGEGVPELCPVCFPLFDDARLKQRAALARAEGRS